MVDKKNKETTRSQRRCGTYCEYLELPGFFCTYDIQTSNNRQRGELKRKIPVISSPPDHPRNSEKFAEERFYKSVLEKILGEEKANSWIAKISEKHSIPEESQVNTFFQTLRDHPTLLRKYVGRKTARDIMRFIDFQDKSNVPIYIKLGSSCPYDKPPTTLREHLEGIKSLGKRAIQVIKNQY